MKRIAAAILAVMMTVGLAVSCGSPAEPSQDTVATKTTESRSLSDAEVTKVVFEQVWAASSVEERDSLCLGIDLFSRGEFIALLTSDVNTSETTVDWDVMYNLIRSECE